MLGISRPIPPVVHRSATAQHVAATVSEFQVCLRHGPAVNFRDDVIARRHD